MNSLRLIKPTLSLEQEYKEMLNEWQATGEHLVPFTLNLDANDFKKLVDQLIGFKNGIGIPDSFVPHSTFWLVNKDNKILGTVNIRHALNDNLLIEGGHIGYGIRPLERGKGYANKILELALKEAKKLGISKAMVTCDKDNIASEKTILKNKGKLFREMSVEGKFTCSFWIEII